MRRPDTPGTRSGGLHHLARARLSHAARRILPLCDRERYSGQRRRYRPVEPQRGLLRLADLPLLPTPGSTDPLLSLGEQAAHQYLRVRKEAIDQAAALLQRGEHREEVLAILEYLARNDLMTSVREKAQDVLKAATQQKTVSPPGSTHPQEVRHLFGVRCQNGHTTIFDRRQVCSQRKEIMRGLDELILTCQDCGVAMAVDVDCEGYE